MEIAEEKLIFGKKAFLIDNWASKVHVISLKLLEGDFCQDVGW